MSGSADRIVLSIRTPYSLIEQLPSPADYNRLRSAVGWGTYDLDTIARCLPQSVYSVCALDADGGVIGMARIVGDGGLVCYIQDVIVLPEWQGQGVGTALMERVMAFLQDHAAPGAVIGLMAATGKAGFYARYGFTVRPDARFGPGMHLRK